MKKAISLITVLVLVFGLLSYSVNATANTKTEDIIRLDNGYYIVIEVVSVENRSTSIKSGSKVYTCKASNGAEQWRATLYGTFTYTGTSATCTSSGCTTTISDSAWYEVSKSAGKSGNSATAEVTMGEKLLGITINRESISMKLTCSPTGTLS